MHNLYDANKCERYKVAEMKKYKDMSKDELLTLKAALMEEYKEEQAKQQEVSAKRLIILLQERQQAESTEETD